MTGRHGGTLFLFCASLGIWGCSPRQITTAGSPGSESPLAPGGGGNGNPVSVEPPPPGGGGGGSPASAQVLDFLGGVFTQLYVSAVGDIDSDGFVEPLATRNDGFGNLIPISPAGLETLVSSVEGKHAERDTRLADFENQDFPDIISNTYDCVDPLNPDDIARLYKNNGDGTFTEVLNPFRDLNGNPITIQGRGETIVVADFNNDGFLDIFLPYYSYQSNDQDPNGPPGAICQNASQSYLLLNDGTGHFVDVADVAGVSLRNWPLPFQVEGAQAVDFYNDGLIDLYAGSHLFVNTGITNGIPRFVDVAASLGLPLFADEGAKFIDAYNDGFLDLVLFDPNNGPALFKFDGQGFVSQPTAFPPDTYMDAVGVNAYDINGDGLEDIITSGGSNCDPKIFLNTGSGFKRVSPQPRPFTLDKSGDFLNAFCFADGAVAFGDLNNDGKIDVLWSTFRNIMTFTNNTKIDGSIFSLEVLGPNGERNQQGRIVRMSPQSRPDVIFTRVVDSGSGYLTQNQYPLLITSPYSEQHVVTLVLPQTFDSNKLAKINFTISPGQRARVFAPSVANPNGRVELVPMRPFTFDPALYPAAKGILE
jgi:VCBS repeat protein